MRTVKLVRFICLPALSLAVAGATAQAPPARATVPAAAAQVGVGQLIGRWVRPDGGYVIAIKGVDASGKLDASYANPNPLPFYTAEATRDASGAIKLFFELRAGGYGGSTYRLSYEPGADRLRGIYYQAVARQSYDVVFERAK